jgi:cytochrome subunit of sulfide dehydrogenase
VSRNLQRSKLQQFLFQERVMIRFAVLAAGFCALFLPPPALAQAVDANVGRDIAANCANCHGTAGRSVGGMPPLAGRPPEELARTMREFRDGKRPATIMHQLAKGYTDAQIAAVAAYFASQKPQ